MLELVDRIILRFIDILSCGFKSLLGYMIRYINIIFKKKNIGEIEDTNKRLVYINKLFDTTNSSIENSKYFSNKEVYSIRYVIDKLRIKEKFKLQSSSKDLAKKIKQSSDID